MSCPSCSPLGPSGGGGGDVESVFGRTGVVVAQTGDYSAGQVDNDSTVPGASVADALNALQPEFAIIQVPIVAIASLAFAAIDVNVSADFPVAIAVNDFILYSMISWPFNGTPVVARCARVDGVTLRFIVTNMGLLATPAGPNNLATRVAIYRGVL